MTRLETMMEYLKPYAVRKLEEHLKKQKKQSPDQLLLRVEEVLEKALETQRQFPEWKPETLCLFHLFSSLVTETYENEIMLADRQFYLDVHQVTGCWKPKIFAEDGMTERHLRRELEKKFVQITDYEVSYLKHWIFYECRGMLEVYWTILTEKIENTENFWKLKKGEDFVFLAGEYMGELKVCDHKEQEED